VAVHIGKVLFSSRRIGEKVYELFLLEMSLNRLGGMIALAFGAGYNIHLKK